MAAGILTQRQRHRELLTRIEDVFLLYAFDVGHGTKNGVECANAQRIVVGNRQPVVTRGIRFQNHMAAFLVDPAVALMFAEQLD